MTFSDLKKTVKKLYKIKLLCYNMFVCVRFSAYGLNRKAVITCLLLGFGANNKMR